MTWRFSIAIQRKREPSPTNWVTRLPRLDAAAGFGGEIVVFALYYPGCVASLSHVSVSTGFVISTTTLPPRRSPYSFAASLIRGTSSAEEVAQLVPQGTPVVKAFNTTFAPTLIAGEAGG